MHNKKSLIKQSKGLRCLFISPFIFTYLFCGHPISIDGQFEDWDDVPVAYNDTEGDGFGADYSSLKITYDSQFLFIYFNFYNGDFLMQDWNDFHYISMLIMIHQPAILYMVLGLKWTGPLEIVGVINI